MEGKEFSRMNVFMYKPDEVVEHTACERRGNTLKDFQAFYLTAKAGIWP